MHALRRMLVIPGLSWFMLLAAFLPAQDLLWKKEGLGTAIKRGREIYRLGDVNSDGLEDLLELVEVHVALGQGQPAIAVSSGKDSSILSISPWMSPWSMNLRDPTPIGDMDFDGIPDYAVTAYDSQSPTHTQHVQVRSSTTHAPL